MRRVYRTNNRSLPDGTCQTTISTHFKLGAGSSGVWPASSDGVITYHSTRPEISNQIMRRRTPKSNHPLSITPASMISALISIAVNRARVQDVGWTLPNTGHDMLVVNNRPGSSSARSDEWSCSHVPDE